MTPMKNSASFKLGDHILFSNDEHHRRHWLDSFKRLSVPKVETRQRHSIVKIKEGKENEPEVPECISAELSRKSRNINKDGYFTISLRKTLLRHSRNSIENT